MAATIHPNRSGAIGATVWFPRCIAKKQAELAKQAAMIAEFQRHVADTINGVTANSMAGANRADFGQDSSSAGSKPPAIHPPAQLSSSATNTITPG